MIIINVIISLFYVINDVGAWEKLLDIGES